jgi:hypothetical protein
MPPKYSYTPHYASQQLVCPLWATLEGKCPPRLKVENNAKKPFVRQMHPWSSCRNAAKQNVEDDR